MIRLADADDERSIARLESAAWGRLGATESIVRSRLERGHAAVIAFSGAEPVAAACFVATAEEPEGAGEFPETFDAFAGLAASVPVRSLYVYSLGVHPRWRGGAVVRKVIQNVIDEGRRLGAKRLVGDGRCPSFNGAATSEPDTTVIRPLFRRAIQEWHRTGRKPDDEMIILDPVLRFYHRTLGCRFLHLAPNFLPEDHASGGYRVIFAMDLTQPAATK